VVVDCEVGDADDSADSTANSLRSVAFCFARRPDLGRAGSGTMRSLRRARSDRWSRTPHSCDGWWRLLAREVAAAPSHSATVKAAALALELPSKLWQETPSTAHPVLPRAGCVGNFYQAGLFDRAGAKDEKQKMAVRVCERCHFCPAQRDPTSGPHRIAPIASASVSHRLRRLK
jgi:hypothetical protein